MQRVSLVLVAVLILVGTLIGAVIGEIAIPKPQPTPHRPSWEALLREGDSPEWGAIVQTCRAVDSLRDHHQFLTPEAKSQLVIRLYGSQSGAEILRRHLKEQ
jgi:hypothetical protein